MGCAEPVVCPAIATNPVDGLTLTLESLLCDTCQGRLPVIGQETAAEREMELRKRAEMSARYHAAVEAEREREGHGWSQEADFS